MKSSTAKYHGVNRLGRILMIATVVSSSVVSTSIHADDAAVLRRTVPTRLPAVSDSTCTKSVKAIRLADQSNLQTTADQIKVQPTSAEISLTQPAATQQAPTRQREIATERQTDWLRSGTSNASNQIARKTLAQAHREFRVGAWLSAETSAWESLRCSAESIDLNRRETGHPAADDPQARAITNLQVAKQAILEARDFLRSGESLSPTAISRMATSHQTDVLDRQPTRGLSGTDASDRYLDFARVRLATIASQSIEAAEALDLLAAIYLRRGDARTIPSATALCLRRAAIQGQPGNASLAANLGAHLVQVGLYDEARWALEHSLSIEPDIETAKSLAKLLRSTGEREEAEAVIASIGQQTLASNAQPTIKVPEITQLTPDEFASLSKSVVWSPNAPTAPQPQVKPVAAQSAPVDSSQDSLPQIVAKQVKATLTSSRTEATSTSVALEPATTTITNAAVEPPKPSPFQRLKNSWQRLTD